MVHLQVEEKEEEQEGERKEERKQKKEEGNLEEEERDEYNINKTINIIKLFSFAAISFSSTFFLF